MPENTKKKKTKRTKKTIKEPKKAKIVEVSEPKKEEIAKPSEETDKGYFEAVGRRKTAIARVRLSTSSPAQSIGEGNFSINNRSYKEYFPTVNLQRVLESPFSRLKSLSRFGGSVKVKGGGQMAQAEAVSNGISRALVLFDINFRKKLKKSGFLHRDDRMVERKKFGLKKARRAPQWSKR